MTTAYETVIGLEVHAQLLTRTKAFCPCATSFAAPPNTHVCPVCLGLPGALPTLNEEAVRMAASAALALGCELQRSSVFSRKNYFYPDLPKGYQITQYDRPLALHGLLDVELDGRTRRARILRVHMEEDAGKTVHGMGDESVVDLNRAGTPLIEIVGEPDLRSGAEAAEYLKRLREILMFTGVNDGNLEQGSFRCDANVSVRRAGEEKLGTRTELKNINSFRFVADAIDVEAKRQIAIVEGGGAVRQQTRGYNSDKRETYLLRDKENEAGYRYFPEPDLPPLHLDDQLLREVREALPESASARRRRYVESLGVPAQTAQVLTLHPEIAEFFEATVRLLAGSAFAVRIANFIQTEVLRDVRTTGLTAEIPVSPKQLAELLRAVDAGTISGKQAKDVYARMRSSKAMPEAIIREQGMGVLRDEGTLVALARSIVGKNPKQAASYAAGRANVLGFFVGLMMKETRGSADPTVVNRVLKDVLAAPSASSASSASPASRPPSSNDTSAPTPTPTPSQDEASSHRSIEPELTSPVWAPPWAQVPTIPPAAKPSPLADSIAPPPPTAGRAAVAREHTLTSASVGAVLLESLEVQTPEEDLATALARIDLRVGRVLVAAHVPGSEAMLDLAVDVGETNPVRVVQELAWAFAPEEMVGKRVLLARNTVALRRARDEGSKAAADAVIVCGAFEDPTGKPRLVLAVVPDRDAPIGTRVGAPIE